ncbi:hypothetical protein HUO13_31895 [Saccharopolyspora erythraea]|uniref:hypothetical protein n=1 Tax=Saccharopolyspora erythraea TaxID=1836 RepID=UPI001BAA7484|nr:hypothetical protein [Saccharopolyspora erythraea]QUH04768.1 hypothetical protein HUO13_31895 [Saccharopolyspora erythraea]
MEQLLLSAREQWCAPGEPISWACPDPFHIPLFEVAGLDEHGRPTRGLLTRAAFQVGALPMRVGALINSYEEQADERYRPSAVVTARRTDAVAVRLSGTTGESPAGDHPGILVATPGRLALLELAEIPESSKDWWDKGFEKVRTAAGPVGRLVEDFAGTMMSTINNRGRYLDQQGQTRTPRVVERASVGPEQITGYDIVRRDFRGAGYDEDNRGANYLRITFTDQSHLDLEVPGNVAGERVLGLVRDTPRSNRW